MKILILLTLFISGNVLAVCATPISRTSVGFGQILSSTKYNSDVNTAYNRLNNLPGDCITDETIVSAKLAPNAVTNTKIVDGAITLAKLAPGVIPEVGRLIRISAFSTSGTWTKQSDVGSIMVQVVGGGGASYHASSTAGSASSFGTHCTGNGGGKPSSSSSVGGAGGTATGGDINITGQQGYRISYDGVRYYYGGNPGFSFLGDYGSGGMGSFSFRSAGGGAGGYCSKLIVAADLTPTVAVTVGTGGTNPGSDTTPGRDGVVLVYEYSN